MRLSANTLATAALAHAPWLLLAGVLGVFGSWSPKFLAADNLMNILVQSSSIAIVAVGMTFVLLTAGIDLSVGAVMFLAAGVAGKLAMRDLPAPVALAAMLAVGLGFGLVNATFVARLKMVPFIVTLATFFVGRGLGLWLTQTRAMNLPPGFRQVATARLLGVPFPVLALAAIVLVGHVVLSRTAFGRQVYAVGNDAEAAAKAGLNTRRILTLVYMISGLCAAIGGIVSLVQLGAVSPTFGREREFDAIAAAVLGGTSLFGGRGSVFPGAVLGAVLIQSVYNGLNIVNANPYAYPLITGGIIFVAVLLDCTRQRQLARIKRRTIRVEEGMQ